MNIKFLKASEAKKMRHNFKNIINLAILGKKNIS